jgi:vacuolar-type H+-ATPase subunit H
MSYFQRPADDHEATMDPQDERRPVGSRLAEFGDRLARAFTRLEPEPEDEMLLERDTANGFFGPTRDSDGRYEDSTFPVDPLGYNRDAVDARIAELERDLAELRATRKPMSITEEIEHLGEQTASILIVAHDQATETTRRAEQEAERRIAEARVNARAITEDAKRNLRTLDDETDAVWRERARLLEDVRNVGNALLELAQSAAERFPAEATQSFPAPSGTTVASEMAAPSDMAVPPATPAPIAAPEQVPSD